MFTKVERTMSKASVERVILRLCQLMVCLVLAPRHVLASNTNLRRQASPIGYNGMSVSTKNNMRKQRLTEERDLIIGGRDAEGNDRYPFMVSIVDQHGRHQCGGSLIAKDVVLSAAHCGGVLDNGGKLLIGLYNLISDKDDAEVFTSVNKVIHPYYNKNNGLNDFMLVQLSSASSKPYIALNSDRNTPEDNDELTVLGWGSSAHNGEGSSAILQEAEVIYETNEECSKSKGRVDNIGKSYGGLIQEEHLCAIGDQNEDSCNGDSGGPLIVKDANGDIQVGVVSWGFACAHSQFPGVYARVSSQYIWIKEQTCELSSHAHDYFDECIDKPTAAPTLAPSYSQETLSSITVEIKLDNYPEEVGFYVRKKGESEHVEGSTFPTGSFGEHHNEVISRVIRTIEPCNEYEFVGIDTYGDGIMHGYIRAFLGTSNTDTLLVDLKGGWGPPFQANVERSIAVSFETPCNSNSPPSIAPSKSPSLPPSSSPESDQFSAERMGTIPAQCTHSDECPDGFCSRRGFCKNRNGSACTSNEFCALNNCVNGICRWRSKKLRNRSNCTSDSQCMFNRCFRGKCRWQPKK